MKRTTTSIILSILAWTIAAAVGRGEAPRVQFSRDVLPILAENCFQCHGPDEKARKNRPRFDTREGALLVLVPGKSAESELIHRIEAAGDGLMPPAKSNRKLTTAQKELLRRWVDEGAPWGKHWAFETPIRPPVPAVKNLGWIRNPIDRFVLARLEKEGLSPAPEAARATLLRRVRLDLTGLPPTPAEVDDFLADASPDAYEKRVDCLLASPRYGERLAMDWLDDARYADTNGYQNDFARTMWPWRDWVINAYNRNLPFDRFVIEQIAGDLLPNPTLEQRVASGFNRNNRTVTEGGSLDEEWRVENNVDRVETTATVFLGLTMGCCRCHDHKYDPVPQKEFYQFYAFFNSINEKGVYNEQRGNVAPLIAVPSRFDRERLKQLDDAIVAADRVVREQEAALPERQKRWEQEERARTPLPEPTDWEWRCPLDGNLGFVAIDGHSADAVYHGTGPPAWVESPFGKALQLDGQENSFLDAGQSVRLQRTDRFSYGGWVKPHGGGAILSKMDDAAGYRGFDLLLADDKVLVHLVHAWPDKALKVATREPLARDTWSHLFVTYDGSGKAGGIRVYVNGRPAPVELQNDRLADTIATQQPFRLGKRSTALPLKGALADLRVYRRTLPAEEVQAIVHAPLLRILRTSWKKRSKAEQDLLGQVFRAGHATELVEAQRKAAQLRQEKADYEKAIPTVMVMEELSTPRATFVLKRGRYDVPDKTQPVQPGVPACLSPWPAGAPGNRLGLARWLMDPANPLTARVAVNRFWQRYFGLGFVKTTENFGLQGEPPSHPELLDWLATEFIRTGWNIKVMQRLIVTSATYRQSSGAAPALVQRDPDNRLLAHGPRFRLPAEVVRDNALAISGLLVEWLGGPPIKPYQPEGLWADLAGGAGEAPYVQDHGPGLYRRSLYVYRKRTVPHPSMATFDAPSREICQVRRSRTNTPLQALELLNDVTYVEAARQLAQRMLTEGGATPEKRLAFAFRRATARGPGAAELRILVRGLEHYRQSFHTDPEAARRLVRQGDSPVNDKLDPVEVAAYTAAAGVILNLDETITKE